MKRVTCCSRLAAAILFTLGMLPVVFADVAGFDNTVDDEFWNTTGRTDTRQISVPSTPSEELFCVPGHQVVLQTADDVFVVPGGCSRNSEPLGRRFSTKPFAMILVFR